MPTTTTQLERLIASPDGYFKKDIRNPVQLNSEEEKGPDHSAIWLIVGIIIIMVMIGSMIYASSDN